MTHLCQYLGLSIEYTLIKNTYLADVSSVSIQYFEVAQSGLKKRQW